MKKVFAISGGVDSMVMLDLFCRGENTKKSEILVAHFDHGIRDNSADDADFVRKMSSQYGVEFRGGRAELGEGASEALAREKRYEFLQQAALEWGGGRPAEIYTAHHLDDLVESVAINYLRGTGWRGLAVFGRANVRRPLLESELIYEPMDKAAIFEYAAKRGLSWREDPSNSWDDYLRNRLRGHFAKQPLKFEQKLELYQLWRKQRELKCEIDEIVSELLPKNGDEWQREWFRTLNEEAADRTIAIELLRRGAERAGIAATRPQLEDFRQAIINYASGKKFNLPNDRLITIKKTCFNL